MEGQSPEILRIFSGQGEAPAGGDLQGSLPTPASAESWAARLNWALKLDFVGAI